MIHLIEDKFESEFNKVKKDFADSQKEWWKNFWSFENHVALGAAITGGVSIYFLLESKTLAERIAGIIGLAASAGIFVDTYAHLYLH